MRGWREDLSSERGLSGASTPLSTRVVRGTQEMARNLYLLDFVGAHPGHTQDDEKVKIE